VRLGEWVGLGLRFERVGREREHEKARLHVGLEDGCQWASYRVPFIFHFAFSFYVRVWGYDLDLRANNTLLFSPPFL